MQLSGDYLDRKRQQMEEVQKRTRAIASRQSDLRDATPSKTTDTKGAGDFNIDFGKLPAPVMPDTSYYSNQLPPLSQKLKDLQASYQYVQSHRGPTDQLRSLEKQINDVLGQIETLQSGIHGIESTYNQQIKSRENFITSQQGIAQQTFKNAQPLLEQELANLGILHGGALSAQQSNVAGQLSLQGMQNLGAYDQGNLGGIQNLNLDTLNAIQSLRNVQRSQQLAMQMGAGQRDSMQSIADLSAKSQAWGAALGSIGDIYRGYRGGR